MTLQSNRTPLALMIQTFLKRVTGWASRLYSHPMNRRQPIRAMLRLWRWYDLQRSGGERVYTFWKDREVICWADSQSSMWLILNEIMDWDEFHFMARYLKPGDIVFDIGANIGVYSLWASRFVAGCGRVYAFEPDPANFRRCSLQIELNELGNVVPEQLALADQVGVIGFSQGEDMMNSIVTNGSPASSNTIEVIMTTMDLYCKAKDIPRVAFAKIDVEGFEEKVLQGSLQLLKSKAIDVLQLEFNEQASSRGLDSINTITLLSDCGYQLYRCSGADGSLERVSHPLELGHVNLMAIADIESVRGRVKAY
jgi:FkbM family methyltransferase